MKKRLKEMEDEAAALREMQAKVEKEMSSVQGFFLLFFAFPIPFTMSFTYPFLLDPIYDSQYLITRSTFWAGIELVFL